MSPQPPHKRVRLTDDDRDEEVDQNKEEPTNQQQLNEVAALQTLTDSPRNQNNQSQRRVSENRNAEYGNVLEWHTVRRSRDEDGVCREANPDDVPGYTTRHEARQNYIKGICKIFLETPLMMRRFDDEDQIAREANFGDVPKYRTRYQRNLIALAWSPERYPLPLKGQPENQDQQQVAQPLALRQENENTAPL